MNTGSDSVNEIATVAIARQLYYRALSSEDRHRADADAPASLSEPARQPPDKYYSQAKLWREASHQPNLSGSFETRQAILQFLNPPRGEWSRLPTVRLQ
jgi:hypothetical protein